MVNDVNDYHKYQLFSRQVDRGNIFSRFFGEIKIGFFLIIIFSALCVSFDWSVILSVVNEFFPNFPIRYFVDYQAILVSGYSNSEIRIGFTIFSSLFFRFIVFPLSIYNAAISSKKVVIDENMHFDNKKFIGVSVLFIYGIFLLMILHSNNGPDLYLEKSDFLYDSFYYFVIFNLMAWYGSIYLIYHSVCFFYLYKGRN